MRSRRPSVRRLSVLATEQAAGHDTSASQPGADALTTVVTDGDARCPT